MLDAGEKEATVAIAALLYEGRSVHMTALVLSLVPLANALAYPSLFAAFAAALAMAALVTETYFAIRTGIDAKLFDHLAREDLSAPSPLADLDRGLKMAGFAQSHGTRSLADRIVGTHGLFRRQCIAAAIPIVLALALVIQVTPI